MRAIKARKHKRIKQKPFSSFFAEDIDEWDAWEKDQLAQEIAMGGGMMFVERVYDIKEFKELIDKNFRVHYKIEYTREMDGISHKLVFKLQGISKPYLVGNKESIHIVEYLKTYSLKWNDEEVIKTIEENPTLKTDDAINRLFERKIEEWLKIAEEFNATHGEFGGI